MLWMEMDGNGTDVRVLANHDLSIETNILANICGLRLQVATVQYLISSMEALQTHSVVPVDVDR